MHGEAFCLHVYVCDFLCTYLLYAVCSFLALYPFLERCSVYGERKVCACVMNLSSSGDWSVADPSEHNNESVQSRKRYGNY
jgi:hypothetical protein